MRHIGRHEDEIAGIRLGDELQPFAPTHPRHAAHHVDDALQRAVMVCARLGVRVNDHRLVPNLLRTAGRIHGRGAQHARRLRRVAVQPGAFNDFDAVDAPVALLGIRHGSSHVALRDPRTARDLQTWLGYYPPLPTSERLATPWPLITEVLTP